MFIAGVLGFWPYPGLLIGHGAGVPVGAYIRQDVADFRGLPAGGAGWLQGKKECLFSCFSRRVVCALSQEVAYALATEEPLASHGARSADTHRANLAFAC
jgi:hypothetical protein